MQDACRDSSGRTISDVETERVEKTGLVGFVLAVAIIHHLTIFFKTDEREISSEVVKEGM